MKITFDESIFTETTKPEVLTIEAANNGYTIEPADTKFGRLGTYYSDSEGNLLPTNYGLYDPELETTFLIAYFNQAATFKGTRPEEAGNSTEFDICLLYTSPSPRDKRQSRMPSSA